MFYLSSPYLQLPAIKAGGGNNKLTPTLILLFLCLACTSLAADEPKKPKIVKNTEDKPPNTPELIVLPLAAGILKPYNRKVLAMTPKEFFILGKTDHLLKINKNFDELTTIPASTELDIDQVIVGSKNDVYFKINDDGPIWSCGKKFSAPNFEKVKLEWGGGNKTAVLNPSKLIFQGDNFLCPDSVAVVVDKLPDDGRIYSRWGKQSGGPFIVRPFYFKDEKFTTTVPVTFVPDTDQNRGINGRVWADCGTACNKGKLVRLTMNRGGWDIMVALNLKKCHSFKVCLNPSMFEFNKKIPICTSFNSLEILAKSGFVKWPGGGRGSFLKFERGDVAYIVISYGFKKEKGPAMAEIVIFNSRDQIVMSDTKGYRANDMGKLVFVFPEDDCLEPSVGVHSENIRDGHALVPPSLASTMKKGKMFTEDGIEISEQQEASLTTPTPEPVVILKYTTTLPWFNSALNRRGGNVQVRTEATNSLIYVEGKIWTWGYLVGFIVGTLVGYVIFGVIFYFLRRTIYSYWYRGMYKRYGCDVSGTTGGVTGIGFGTTTTGAITVQNTSGGTTATTGGDTSSVLGTTRTDRTEKTGGTLAM